jgi:chromatin remodeling complex protein RSC6
MYQNSTVPDSKPSPFDVFMDKVLRVSVLEAQEKHELAQLSDVLNANIPKQLPRQPSKVTAAFMRPMQPSAHLAAIVGSVPLPRTEVVKRLWEYIKVNKLQDQTNKRLIHCDEQLFLILGKAEVTMFELAGLVGKSMTPLRQRWSST